MNIAYFLTPRQEVQALYDDNTLRKGLEVMRNSTYSAMPVTTRDNIYLGTVSIADFLWYLFDDIDDDGNIRTKNASKARVQQIMKRNTYPAVNITATVEELMGRIVDQNFVPVVDGRGALMGIVTRHKVMDYFNNSGVL
ncbi:MAG: CBS domain-containing protein [Oscillospiraceae bacterium]|nr:CBS domain-containing protein [Oscillospiraceae bacterium]MDO5137938.1 CBS domain-containing protein [Oscillospiraceae bacterium]